MKSNIKRFKISDDIFEIVDKRLMNHQFVQKVVGDKKYHIKISFRGKTNAKSVGEPTYSYFVTRSLTVILGDLITSTNMMLKI